MKVSQSGGRKNSPHNTEPRPSKNTEILVYANKPAQNNQSEKDTEQSMRNAKTTMLHIHQAKHLKW